MTGIDGGSRPVRKIVLRVEYKRFALDGLDQECTAPSVASFGTGLTRTTPCQS